MNYSENIRIIVTDCFHDRSSLAIKTAGKQLSKIHSDIADILINVANIACLANSQNIDRIALSYSDSVLKEIASTQKNSLNRLDKIHAVNNAVRSVIIQEAALEFMRLNGNDLSGAQTCKISGNIAIKILERMGYDIIDICRKMGKTNVKALATGQYHRIEDKYRQSILALLKVAGNDHYTSVYGPKHKGCDFGPFINVPKNHELKFRDTIQLATYKRKLSFREKMEEAEIARRSAL